MEKQLLDTFLELYTYEQNINSWSFDSFEEKTPRYYRLQIIDTLMKALEINCSYSQFCDGKFITNVQYKKWADFKKSNENRLPQDLGTIPPSMTMDAFAIGMLFRTLMRYRLYAKQLLSSNDGIYAASGEFRAFLELMNAPSRKLIEELKTIDAVLLFCINPTGISYTKEELIANFGFPEVNINDVDIDFM
jgi:hypothetical protein